MTELGIETIILPVFIAVLTAVFVHLIAFVLPTRNEKQKTKHAVTVIASQLERFSIQCAELISQHELERDSEGYAGAKATKLPTMESISESLELSGIDSTLLSEANSFVNVIHLSESQIRFWWDVLGEIELVQQECFEQAGLMGNRAIILASKLCRSIHIPEPDYSELFWDFKTKLKDVSTAAQIRRKKEMDETDAS